MGTRVTSRSATPLGDPRGIPKSSFLLLRINNCLILGCLEGFGARINVRLFTVGNNIYRNKNKMADMFNELLQDISGVDLMEYCENVLSLHNFPSVDTFLDEVLSSETQPENISDRLDYDTSDADNVYRNTVGNTQLEVVFDQSVEKQWQSSTPYSSPSPQTNLLEAFQIFDAVPDVYADNPIQQPIIENPLNFVLEIPQSEFILVPQNAPEEQHNYQNTKAPQSVLVNKPSKGRKRKGEGNYEHMRELNNLACKRYRENTKQSFKQLEQELMELQKVNSALNQKLESVSSKVNHLQTFIIQKVVQKKLSF